MVGNKFIDFNNQSGNTSFLNTKNTINKEKMYNDDTYRSMMNRATLKPIKNVNNNSENNVNILLQPIKKNDKLPSISNAYDPKFVANENTNL